MGIWFLGISFFLGRVSNFDMGLCKEYIFFFGWGFVSSYNYDVLCGFRSEEMASAREIIAAEFLQVCCHVHSIWLLRNYRKIYGRLGIL